MIGEIVARYVEYRNEVIRSFHLWDHDFRSEVLVRTRIIVEIVWSTASLIMANSSDKDSVII